jgi:hypothetical protein
MNEQIKIYETTKWSCACDDYILRRLICIHMQYVRQAYRQLNFFSMIGV